MELTFIGLLEFFLNPLALFVPTNCHGQWARRAAHCTRQCITANKENRPSDVNAYHKIIDGIPRKLRIPTQVVVDKIEGFAEVQPCGRIALVVQKVQVGDGSTRVSWKCWSCCLASIGLPANHQPSGHHGQHSACIHVRGGCVFCKQGKRSMRKMQSRQRCLSLLLVSARCPSVPEYPGFTPARWFLIGWEWLWGFAIEFAG